MLTALRIIRGVCGFLFIMQALMLLPAVSWLQQPGTVTGNMLAIAFIKLVAMAVFGVLFVVLRKLINRLHVKKYGTDHPSLAKALNF